MEDAEARLKRFLHYGSETRLYEPQGDQKYSFEPEAASSIEELLGDDKWAEKIVPTIEKVDQLQTSVAPSALIFALAKVIRKARVNMEKKSPLEDMNSDIDVEKKEEDVDDNQSNSNVTEVVCESRNDEHSNEASSKKKSYKPEKPQKWDLIMRDAYKVARKLSEHSAENLFLFTHYLREIAKSEGKKGFGQGWRATVTKWYDFQSSLSLAQSVTKLYEGSNWTHANVLKLLRWKYHENKAKDAILLYVLYNFKKVMEKYEHSDDQNLKRVIKHLKLIDDLRHAKDAEHALEYVKNNPSISFDFVPSVFHTSHAIWLLLIERMTPEELLSFICRLSRLRMFKYPEIIAKVVSKFEELNQPKQAGPDSTPVLINPFEVFITRKNYEEGPNLAVEFQYLQRKREIAEENDRPQGAANPRRDPQEVFRQPPPKRNPEIINCLNNVFENSISSFAATGKKFLIAVDAQGAIAGKRCLHERFVTTEEAALLVILGVIRAEPAQNVKLVTFTKEPGFIREIPISVCNEGQLTKTTDTMDSLKSKILKDDCVNGNVGKLIRMAMREKAEYDVFIVLSDNMLAVDDAYGALKSYKNNVYADAKLITCCFIGHHKKEFELMEPGMLLICGFDKNVGNLIQAYSRNSFPV